LNSKQIKMEQLLQQISSGQTSISYAIRYAVENGNPVGAMLMLKSMVFDNEDLMISTFGQKIVNEIKNENIPLAN
jgi:hypothetical protein